MDSEKRKEQKRLAAKKFREKHPEIIKYNNTNYYVQNKESIVEKQKQYYIDNKDKIIEKQKKRYEFIKEAQSIKYKTFRKDNPILVKERDRKYYFKKKYGISLMQLAEMWESQNGLCGNLRCQKPLTNEKGGFAVDHSHKTGAIRELLCRACNVSLGNLDDDVSKLMGLIFYLKKHESVNYG